jgi:alpha-L-rhamnosidase
MLSLEEEDVSPADVTTQPTFGNAVAIVAEGGGGLSSPAPLFRRFFEVGGEVSRATLRITALGVFRAYINGARVGEDELAPGWTDYRHRLTWTDYDVTSLLRRGVNEIQALVGNGWYRGRLGRPARRDLYGTDLALLAELRVSLRDGTTVTIDTDHEWEWRNSHVVADDLYDGCIQDLRPGGPEEWLPVGTECALPRIERATAPPVQVLERRPVAVEASDSSVNVDVGRNIVGWLELRVGPRASERHIQVQHAEVREGGVLARRPLRDAAATDGYILAPGDDEIVIAPVHTFHGFRFADITGLPAEEVVEITAVVVGTNLADTGAWSSSDPMLNTLHQNVRNSSRGNFLSIPTDCPQRDERLGWTADAQVFAPVATYLYDVTAFLGSWLDDMQASQASDGSIPVVIPDIYRRPSVATAGWGDACVIVPWELYAETGDVGLLRKYWPMATAWIARVDSAVDADGIWVDGHQYGDWLDPNAPPQRPGQAMTDPSLVATAYRVRVLGIMSHWALKMGGETDGAAWKRRWQRARRQFQQRFVTPRGFLTSETQAAYALAIAFGLLDDEQVASAGERLADLVRVTDFTVGTGFLGTPVLLEALSATGHHEVALRVLLGRRAPSWLYAVSQGATSIWERWDSMMSDGSVNPGEMTSFNHFAFGAVARWMHEELAGLRRLDPGWERAAITAPLWSHLSTTTTEHRGPQGWWRVSWVRQGDGSLLLELEVPEGSSALLNDGQGNEEVVPHGRHLRRYTVPGELEGAVTLRQVMDDENRWDQVVAAVQNMRPDWSRRDIAREVLPYLNRPLADFARIVGLSIPTAEEASLRADLVQLQH